MHREPGFAAVLTSDSATKYVGQAIERLEDAALLTGCGAFADDLGVKPGTMHAAILRSPHAHAELLAIDASAALEMPGVRAVLTGEDVKRWSQPFVVGVKQPMQHWALAIDRVRYVGEPIAVVIAEDRYLAEDAVDAIRVDYQPLAAVIGIKRALDPASPVLHPALGGNVISERAFRYGDPEAAFERASRRVSLVAHYPRNSCTPIETYGVVAVVKLPR